MGLIGTGRVDDVGADEEAVRSAVEAASVVVATGAGTQRDVGNPVEGADAAAPIRAPSGIVTYDPAELTVTVLAGTPIQELGEVLAAAGQECALDPRDFGATVGGFIACGLSGHRRLRYGPLRDRVLEVRFVTGDARIVRGGGPTVKNVTGYDMPRLLVGSLGTLGVITRVILRCQPQPLESRWFAGEDPDDARERCFRPSAILWRHDASTHVRLEGHPHDVEAQRASAGLEAVDAGPATLVGPHRGRISVAPRRVREVGGALTALGDDVRWVAEWGIGTIHVVTDEEQSLARARDVAERVGGWMLREAGAPALDGFGRALPNEAVMARVKGAFDPLGKLSPGRIRVTQPVVEAEVLTR